MAGGAFAGLTGFPADPSQFAFLDDSYSFNAPSLMGNVDIGSLPTNVPQIGGAGGGIGALGIANAAIGGIQALGNLWMGMKGLKLAKKQFKLNKKMTLTNLANQMKSYNTALADRARSRAVMEGQTEAEMNAYVNNNSLNAKGYKQGAGYTGNNMGSGSLLPGSYASLIPGGITPAPTPVASSSPAPAGSTPTGSGSASSKLSGFSALAGRIAQERSSRDDDRAN